MKSDDDHCDMDDISSYVEPHYIGEEVIIPKRNANDPFLNGLSSSKTSKNIYVNEQVENHNLIEDELEDQNVDPKHKVKSGCMDVDKGLCASKVNIKEKVKDKGNGKQKVFDDGKESNATKTTINRINNEKNKGTIEGFTYKWIAKHYVREVVENPKLSYRAMQADIREIFLINILATNPSSTCKMDVDEGSNGRTCFTRFYVCFKAMKDGWNDGCKRVIGLDGCFLKATCRGELLKAMGRDANNHMFPIALTVVNVENKENWLWFIGLQEAVREWLPMAEHRQCARHIYANLKKNGRWDLNGIPYVHGVAAYCFLNQDPANGVNPMYHKDAWQNTYAYSIKPVGGPSIWVRSELPPLMPPIRRKMPRRPKNKRKKHPTEDQGSSQRVSRVGRSMTCSNCWIKGHNKSGFTNESKDKPTKEVRKAGINKAGASGFVSAASALRMMEMGDSEVTSEGQTEVEHANEESMYVGEPTNVELANVDDYVARPLEPANVDDYVTQSLEPTNVDDATTQQSQQLRRTTRIRRPSQ
ncbi:zinc finger, PMZ-type containing protein, partial [Tanacetum coccineum]